MSERIIDFENIGDQTDTKVDPEFSESGHISRTLQTGHKKHNIYDSTLMDDTEFVDPSGTEDGY